MVIVTTKSDVTIVLNDNLIEGLPGIVPPPLATGQATGSHGLIVVAAVAGKSV